jgi:hypothetical protein
MFADVWLGTNVVDSSVSILDCYRILILIRVGFQVYDGQSSFLDNLFISNFSSDLTFLSVDNIGSDLADGR